MGDLIETAAQWGALALVALAFALAFGDGVPGVDLIVPGEVGMVFIGAAASGADAPFWALVMAAALGAIVGDTFGYFVGRRWGTRVLYRWNWLRRRLEPTFERAHRYFTRRGGVAVFLARWVGALRAVVPVVAGMSDMPYRRFLAWDAPAALLWTTAIVSLGYYFGDGIADVIDTVGIGLSFAMVVLVAALLLVRHRRPAVLTGMSPKRR